MSIYVGNRVEIFTRDPFQDSDGNAFDPDIVTFSIKDPSGTTTEYVYDQDGDQHAYITKNATGDYSLEIDVDTHGAWLTRITGEQDNGDNRGSEEGAFFVDKGDFN